MSGTNRPLVFIASPLAGDIETNIAYAQAAMLDSLERGEAPYVPHLLYPQVLEDTGDSRKMGMMAGKSVLRRCDLIAVYVDLGESAGMRSEITLATSLSIEIERRWIGFVDVDDDSDNPTRDTNVAEL